MFHNSGHKSKIKLKLYFMFYIYILINYNKIKSSKIRWEINKINEIIYEKFHKIRKYVALWIGFKKRRKKSKFYKKLTVSNVMIYIIIL